MAVDRKLLGFAAAVILIGAGGSSKPSKPKKPKGFGPKPDEPEDPNVPEDPAVQVYDDITAPTPTLGMGYVMRKGDNAVKVCAQALGLPQNHPDVQNYVRNRFPATRWGWALYAVQSDGAYSYTFPGTSVEGFPFGAFNPFCDNVRAAVAQGDLPYRRWNFTRSKNKNTGKWLPPTLISGAGLHGPRGRGWYFFPPNTDGHPDDEDRNPMPLLNAIGATIEDLKNLSDGK